MNKPWMREVTFPGQIKLFGLDCPLCDKEQSHLTSMTFAEGIALICEDCCSHSTLADWYVPPSIEEFRERLAP